MQSFNGLININSKNPHRSIYYPEGTVHTKISILSLFTHVNFFLSQKTTGQKIEVDVFYTMEENVPRS